MITDETYFLKGYLTIPNIVDESSDAIGDSVVLSELESAILKYEREVMINALGVTLFDELETALADLPSADQKWKDLVDGVNYTLNDVVFRWDGLRGFDKDSLVAYFIYCEYKRNDELTYTTTGDVRLEANNALTASSITKYVKAWMNFIEKYQGKEAYYYCKRWYTQYLYTGRYYLDYPASYRLYQNTNNIVQVSLFQFLNDSNELDATAFPDFQFRIYAPANRWGI